MRYRPPSGAEAEMEPGSHGRVLRNLLGIKRKREMDRAEYEALIRARDASYQRFTARTRFTAALLCEMHQEWLGTLYAWAGKYRTVELSKAGFQWPPAFRVADNMEAFEKTLLRQHTPCRQGPIPEVSRRLAEVHAELLLIHPFRDGNGRLARWLTELMAYQAGLPMPLYGLQGRGAKERQRRYIDAVQRGYVLDYGELTRFFEDCLEWGLRAVGRGGGFGSPRAPSKTLDS